MSRSPAQVRSRGCHALFPRRLGPRYGELLRDLTGIELGLQFLDLGVLGRGSLLHFAGSLRLGKFDGVPLVLLGQLKPLVQLLLELAVANLLDDVRVPGLVNLECFPAVRAVDFMHDCLIAPALVLGLHLAFGSAGAAQLVNACQKVVKARQAEQMALWKAYEGGQHYT